MSEENKLKGLHLKYKIERFDGKQINPEEEFFVLKLTGKEGLHKQASLEAIAAYSRIITKEYPRLASDINKRYKVNIDSETKNKQ